MENAVLLSNFAYWESKKSYLVLMENFINQKIDGLQFQRKFYEMWRRDSDKKYTLKEFLEKMGNEPLTKEKLAEFKGFQNLLADLFTDCDVFQPDSALREEFELSEEEFRNCVKRAFLDIKDRYP